MASVMEGVKICRQVATNAKCEQWHEASEGRDRERPFRRPMNRTSFAALLCSLCLVAAAGASATLTARTAQADFTSTIKHRFIVKGYGIYAPPVGASYGPVIPNQAFYVTVDFATQHAFNFYVFIYATGAKAEAAYDRDANRLARIGSPGASRVGVAGRVEYLGTTAPLNTSGGPAPTLPPGRFAAMMRLAQGR